MSASRDQQEQDSHHDHGSKGRLSRMQPMYYPLFVSLEERVCLVVGGGSVGERKIKGLLRFGATVHLVSQGRTPWVQEQCEKAHIRLLGAEYSIQALQGVDLVFAATSDRALNRRIAADARMRKIWCNMATDPDEGSCMVPSIFQQGPLTIAIGTGGLSPALARRIREGIEAQFGREWAILLHFMGLVRKAVQACGMDTAENQAIFQKISQLPLTVWIQNNQKEPAIRTIHPICKSCISWEALNQFWDESWNLFSSSSLPSATASERSDT
ncbi:bifunctional precorrin-2 dehydrogenase/sirohydrochlorin ferrochelatase [Desulforhabdus sp. TSK]|uniref:precorrin-2 dehydrogenase/sirohydrochlorin ferrochelatase family protein n=1 Tax=Desulforhabdus sp. TSK TaxID=2925014 RepID=UPI001FC8B189|nr:bifunctional precorrin-2 dehydrogenase/sirohydrochlorin ferrochelatase [Desulforhabdus sp. TSK]